MKKLDWYILRQYLTTFLFSLILFAFITIAVDASEKAEDFIKSQLSFWEIAREYYSGFIPHIISLLFPIFVLISVVFFTSRLATRNEIIAMLSTGMSLKRILLPYWIGSLMLALGLGLSNHYLIPIANKIRTTFESKYVDMGSIGKGSQYITNLHLRIDSFTYAGIRNYDTVSKTGQGFYLQRVRNQKVEYNLRSETFAWDTTKKQWRLDLAIERKINGLREDVALLPNYYIKLGYQPYDIAADEYKKDRLKTPELIRLINKEERRGSEGVNALKFERYRRDAYAVAVIIMTMIAAILASRKIRGGSGLHLALAFIIGVSFIMCDKFSMVFSTKGNFPPIVAAWFPNFLFGILALYLYRRSPK